MINQPIQLIPGVADKALRGDSGFGSHVDIEADLHQEVDQQPDVVEEHGEAEVPEPDREVFRGDRGGELLDLRIRCLDSTTSAVALDFALGTTPMDSELVVDGFVRVEWDGSCFLGVRRFIGLPKALLVVVRISREAEERRFHAVLGRAVFDRTVNAPVVLDGDSAVGDVPV